MSLPAAGEGRAEGERASREDRGLGVERHRTEGENGRRWGVCAQPSEGSGESHSLRKLYRAQLQPGGAREAERRGF